MNSSMTSLTVTPLQPDTTYAFRIVAENEAGMGKSSAMVPVTTAKEKVCILSFANVVNKHSFSCFHAFERMKRCALSTNYASRTVHFSHGIFKELLMPFTLSISFLGGSRKSEEFESNSTEPRNN